jgi:hypothetical protein
MKTTINLLYNILIGVNGVLLLLGAYEIASFLAILAILYATEKLVSPIIK